MYPSSLEKISLLLFLCFQSRPFFPPPPYQVLVHGQGEGREEGRLWGDFGGMGAWVVFRGRYACFLPEAILSLQGQYIFPCDGSTTAPLQNAGTTLHPILAHIQSLHG